jgi:PAS domain-containing protein
MAIRDAGKVEAQTSSPGAAALMDSLPVGVACIDADLRVVLVNGVFAAALGVAAGAEIPVARAG